MTTEAVTITASGKSSGNNVTLLKLVQKVLESSGISVKLVLQKADTVAPGKDDLAKDIVYLAQNGLEVTLIEERRRGLTPSVDLVLKG